MLHAAYNDSRGVTAAFNLNLLARLNRELGADFDLDASSTTPSTTREHARIEMRLVSRRAQIVTRRRRADPLPRRRVHRLGALAQVRAAQESRTWRSAAGWRLGRRWIDDDARFSVSLLPRA